MAKARIKLNKAGVGALLKSPEMQSIVREHARAIAGRAGDGYYSDTYMGRERVMASAYTGTTDAMQDNLDNDTLVKAMRG